MVNSALTGDLETWLTAAAGPCAFFYVVRCAALTVLLLICRTIGVCALMALRVSEAITASTVGVDPLRRPS